MSETGFRPVDVAVPDESIAARFRSVVRSFPNRLAIVDPLHRCTFSELERAAAALAAQLLAGQDGRDGADRDVPVAALVRHGVDSVVVIVAAALAGRMLTMIDPGTPGEQLAGTLRRLRSTVFVTDRPDDVAPSFDGRIIDVRRVDGPRGSTSDTDDTESTVLSDPGPWCAASAVMTSGSSGVPKVVVHSHRNVVANAQRYIAATGISEHDRVLLTAPFSFLAAATHLWSSLLGGATLCCHDLATRGASDVASFIESESVTVAHFPPSALGSLPSDRSFGSVRLVGLDGDRVTSSAIRAGNDRFPNAVLISRYCCSEANWIASMTYQSSESSLDGAVLLGAPTPWIGLELLDSDGRRIEDGEVGEVVVGGDHLALGYLDDPERTAHRFSTDERGRWYRTGDRAKRRADGILEFVGRVDDVVKIRSNLVDLAAVHAALVALAGVDEAAVAVAEDAAGDGLLVAAVTGDSLRPWQVRAELARRVARSMVPARISVVEQLPVNDRGKVDVAAVASLHDGHAPYVSPRDDTEATVAAAFARVLGLDRVGRDDDIFALGADSLAVVELCAALGEGLGRRFEPFEVLEAPTPALLAAASGVSLRRPGSVLVKVQDGRPVGPVLLLVSGGSLAHVDSMARFARHLGDHEAYSFLPHGFRRVTGTRRRVRLDRSISAMADRIAAELSSLVGDRDLVMVGHSGGGNVVLDVARRLRARSASQVRLVVLLDARPATTDLRERRKLYRRSQRLDRRLRRWWYLATASLTDDDARHRAFERVTIAALERHLDEPYAGSVLLVRAAESLWSGPHDLGWPEVGLTALSTATVPGDHNGMLTGPRALLTGKVVGARIRELIAAEQTDASLSAARRDASVPRTGRTS